MPKAEAGTPKWLANKMKSKGLQKLKWYCQMCEKQCRDENGFKCHMVSESHARQMQVFSQSAGRFMDEFSRTFEQDFMRLMRTRYCRQRVLANTVYCEVIANKTHVHMNATSWVTLGEFVRYLGETGKCEIENTPRGWYLTYVDPDLVAHEEKMGAMHRDERTQEALEEKRLRKGMKQVAMSVAEEQPERSVDENVKVKLSFGNNSQGSPKPKSAEGDVKNLFTAEAQTLVGKRPQSKMDQLIADKRIKRIRHDVKV